MGEGEEDAGEVVGYVYLKWNLDLFGFGERIDSVGEV